MPSKKLIAASTEPIVLGVLMQGESYGYAIIQSVRELSGGMLEWTDGMLYPVLHRLERKGLISAKWRESEQGRKRRYYRISSRGKKELAEERRQWESIHAALDTLWRGCNA